jgi:hypothetical protein
VDHTDVALKSVVRALSDVVAPAVNPEAALAREQLRLATEYLKFAITRVDHLHERAAFELRHQLKMAKAVRAVVAGLPVAAVLDGPVVQGESLLSAGSPRIDDLRQASTALAAGVSTVIRELETSDGQLRSDLIRTVATASRERIVFERSWYAPLGIDPDPDEVPELPVLLASLGQI